MKTQQARMGGCKMSVFARSKKQKIAGARGLSLQSGPHSLPERLSDGFKQSPAT